jgi:lipoprotein-anchoring transpeptidase ErfK/SrfK
LLLGDVPRPEKLRIQISLSAQKAQLIKDGAPVFATDISSGRKGFSTPTGDFVITDKHVTHRSTLYPADMPFFMRLNCRDFGMHQGALPGYPASHGCIRLPSDAAKKLFADVPVGTWVSIRE